MSKIVVIGASTGGPNALEVLFSMLPKELPVPILVAQHLARPFTKSLADRLHKSSGIPVYEAVTDEVIEQGAAYVVPGDSHFFIYDPGPRISLIYAEDLPKPSIDMGLTSVAEHYGPGTIAIVLSGMGADGTIGAKAVKQLGGYVIVQDEATSVVYSMPRAVKDAGLADEVLPLSLIVPHMLKQL
jgi:two-component system, chemotaxis family, protein-glutamate methylesterase/glutaminase